MLKEKLEEALKKTNKEKLESYVWKGKKVKVGDSFVQDEKRLVDSSIEELLRFRTYCEIMLTNQSVTEPGRQIVLKTIKDQRLRCTVELFIRSVETAESGIPRYLLNEQIQTILKHKDIKAKDSVLSDVSVNCPIEYKDLPLPLIIEGCLEKLGVFNRKHITLAFILKQGVWLTQQELAELTEYDEAGNLKNRLDVIRERLNIDKNIMFRINSKGLSYSNLRSVLQLTNKKYNELTTDQLKVLRNRILFNLEAEVNQHIKQWETRIKEINEVIDSKGW